MVPAATLMRVIQKRNPAQGLEHTQWIRPLARKSWVYAPMPELTPCNVD